MGVEWVVQSMLLNEWFGLLITSEKWSSDFQTRSTGASSLGFFVSMPVNHAGDKLQPGGFPV
jgi:hypothetical protein